MDIGHGLIVRLDGVGDVENNQFGFFVLDRFCAGRRKGASK